ncbi:hypothetical protein M0802_015873 [Mischocyttarus mexicanus]|nr:hypothetical protein M0802_015873 [Mischocyttarus mexicanus]
MAELLQWNDLQKLIYGKRMLRGSARRFVESEKGINSWAMLKKKLASEFRNRISSTTVHAQLAERKKRPDETGQEYIYVMKEIAAVGRVEERALLEHIISKIVDEEVNKTFLYQSRTLKELKRNVEVYDKMKRQSKAIKSISRSNNGVGRERRPEPTKVKKASCFSCGSPDHSVKQCSALGKGPKCFRCNEFGHIARECQKRVNMIVASEDVKWVMIQGKEFMALVDSGSDLTLLREDKFTEIGSVELTKTIKRAEEAGNGKIRIIGAFVGEINVDDVVCNIKIYVVPTGAIPNECILGKNVLSNVEVIVRKGKVVKMVQIHEDEEKGKTKRSAELKDDTRSVDGENAEAVCEEDVMKGVLNITMRELDVKPQFVKEVE